LLQLEDCGVGASHRNIQFSEQVPGGRMKRLLRQEGINGVNAFLKIALSQADDSKAQQSIIGISPGLDGSAVSNLGLSEIAELIIYPAQFFESQPQRLTKFPKAPNRLALLLCLPRKL